MAPIQLALPGAHSVGSLTAGDGALTVVWSAPSDNGGTDITAYDLRYIRSDTANKADANWTIRDSIWISGALQYELGDLTDGVRYDVQLRAVTSAGDGPWSASATGTPLAAPEALTIDLITPGDGALAVAWYAPGNHGGADITSYDLRYIGSDATDKADANWMVEQDIWISGALQYELGGLANGFAYDVQVRAGNIVGDGEWSASVTNTPVAPNSGQDVTSNVDPVFTEGARTTRSVSESVAPGTDIGAPVEATDADDDTLTYTLGGPDAESFDIDASTGTANDKAALDASTKSSYTVEVTATDPSDASATITVIITVSDFIPLTDEDHVCVAGGAVADASNTGLLSDCETLLDAQDTLAGSAALNWSEETPIAQWDGITLRGTLERVAWLNIRGGGLDGSLPAALGGLSSHLPEPPQQRPER